MDGVVGVGVVLLGANLGEVYPEELFPGVGFVELAAQEVPVQLAFECRGILTEKQGMDIETEGYRGVPQLAYAVKRFKPARHPDFIDVLPEGANIRDDVDMSRFGLLCHRECPLVLFLGYLQLGFQLKELRLEGGTLRFRSFRCLLLHPVNHLLNSLFLLGGIALGFLELTAGFFLLPNLLTNLALLLTLAHLQLVRHGRPAQLFQAGGEVLWGDVGILEGLTQVIY